MNTYDASWARKVYTTYAKLCTRAQQIDACIQQLHMETYGSKPIRADIVEALCADIRRKGPQRLWREYKRVCKKTPLDVPRLKDLVAHLNQAMYEVDVEKKQRQFDFLDT